MARRQAVSDWLEYVLEKTFYSKSGDGLGIYLSMFVLNKPVVNLPKEK